ncbi:MAG: FlaD/FlaE family flagellar protein [Archaeoglobaceae archaeon]
MLKNTLKKLSSSSQHKGNRNNPARSRKSSKSSKKVKKKQKRAKRKDEEEFDMEDEETFGDEEFDEEEEFGDDDFEEDDEFGDELEGLDDELEDDDSGKVTEIESRIKDVENEVGQVSSKLNTIRSENEEMGNRITEIEENVRKLLGIYEMVTEGINPFATETGYGGGGGLGIFSPSTESKQEEIPEDLSSKDAESFFEDVEEDEEPVMEEDLNIGDDATSPESPSGSGEAPEDMFKKLKDEHDQERAEDMGYQPAGKEEFGDESQAPDFETLHPSETSENIQEAVYETRSHAGQLPKSSSPYLVDIPKDLISDVIALKWMDYLVNTFGIKRMADILDFYVDIGWISKNVKDLLINYSRGYVLREGHIVNEPENPTLKDHFKSLIFISKLSGRELNLGEVEKMVKEVEGLEKDVNDVITEHAFGSNC